MSFERGGMGVFVFVDRKVLRNLYIIDLKMNIYIL